MEVKIDAARWLAAQKACEWRRSQIQGFFYSTEGAEVGEGFHVIRDVSMATGKQRLWDLWSDANGYDKAHAEMMDQIELRKTQVICNYYRDGWAEPAEEATPTRAEAVTGEGGAE